MLGGRKVELGRSHVVLPETDTKTLLVGHDLMVIHRLMEMGSFKIRVSQKYTKAKQYCK